VMPHQLHSTCAAGPQQYPCGWQNTAFCRAADGL
jgi:hypothetical protein